MSNEYDSGHSEREREGGNDKLLLRLPIDYVSGSKYLLFIKLLLLNRNYREK